MEDVSVEEEVQVEEDWAVVIMGEAISAVAMATEAGTEGEAREAAKAVVVAAVMAELLEDEAAQVAAMVGGEVGRVGVALVEDAVAHDRS